MRRLAFLLAFLALTTSADAATLVNSNGRVTLTGTSGEPLDVSFDYGGQYALSAIAQNGNRDPITATGCTTDATTSSSATFFRCEGVNEVVVVGGAGNDAVQAGGLRVPLIADGGGGRDFIVGGEAADTLTGAAGDDTFYAQRGDTVGGGAGVDHAVYQLPWNVKLTGPVTLTLDGVADDGHAGTHANFLPDLENVDVGDAMPHPADPPAPPYGPITLVGTDDANQLIGATGPDTITGGGGIDVLDGRDGDDTLLARDGLPDRVRCGAGTDTALVDPFDVVSPTCETILVAGERPAVPIDDAAPRIAWRPGTDLGVSVEDDRGIASVRWLDDDRVICVDTVAPYDCAFTPTAGDVGRNTLTAIATDSSGQTAAVTTTKTVARFKATAITLRIRNLTATGKVTLPANVPCTGKVRVGGKTATLRTDCTYRVKIKRARSYVAEYLGTAAIAPTRSKRVRA
ncbi:Ig-like domain-containing protein [Solirubrobacter phytolaccae]|uniref:Ig-like domain-containing protein n=1 Tax=Solirubrobacter phytolaccae TaxID=1404360 RepID=A0A9X3S9U0_9ACTN|nr:Ig-like domain-containing protein [Solirubrobacter phytolaccae]MDA0182973.1 Ig-like domain-containing protein [Solirubrobacter phytolaccae]